MFYDPGPRQIGWANRSLVILRPRPPLVAWVRRCDPSTPIPAAEVAGATEALMIPAFDLTEDAWAWIEENADILFEVALESWYTDPDLWPDRRDFAALREWFEVELVDVVWDVVDAPLTSDPEVPPGPGDDAWDETPPPDGMPGGDGNWH
jgi:hypothetical protein